MKAAQRFLAPALCLALCGCAALGGKHEPYSIHTLSAPAASASAATPVDWQLLIERPHASRALDTARIAVVPRDGVIEYYANARWSDPVPDLLQDRLLHGFANDSRLRSSAVAAGLSGDFSLATNVQQFGLELGSDGAMAVLNLTATLIDRPSNRIIARQGFQARIPASTEIESTQAALQEASNQVTTQLIEWTLGEGNSARGAKPEGSAP